jgi:short-subunit dehydrogenase
MESGKRAAPTPEGPTNSRVAVVTGASSGIGREFARLAAGDGYEVVLVARRRERLEELARELTGTFGVAAIPLAADLSNPAAPERIFREVTGSRPDVDLLVNAAGLGVHGMFADAPLDRQLETLQVNVLALTALTKLFLTGMRERRRGVIVNLASTAAFQPGPFMAVYYASKAYVLSVTEALAEELRGTGVTATALCPGPTVTEFQKLAGVEDTPLFTGSVVSDAATVARAGYEGAMKGKRVVVPGQANRILGLAARIGPRRLSTRVARRLQEKRSRRPRKES